MSSEYHALRVEDGSLGVLFLYQLAIFCFACEYVQPTSNRHVSLGSNKYLHPRALDIYMRTDQGKEE